MSMYLDFEPHSWYKGAAIRLNPDKHEKAHKWVAYLEDGNMYRVQEFSANSLRRIRELINEWYEWEADKQALQRKGLL